MVTNQPPKRRIVNKAPAVKPSDWLNFSSAVVVAVFTSIFFTSGWVYISTWFSFYGLNANDLQVPTQTILINGIPGVFVSCIIGFATISSLGIEKSLPKKGRVDSQIRLLFILAITAEGAILFLFSIIFFLISISSKQSYDFLIQSFTSKTPEVNYSTAFAVMFVVYSIVAFFIVTILLYIFDKSKTYKEMIRNNKTIMNMHKIVIHAINLPQIRTGSILILYFIIAMVISFFMGEIDARRGGQLMSSNWKMPLIFLHSEKPITSLEAFDFQTPNEYEYIYGPFKLLYENSTGYYLVIWKEESFYAKSPAVFFLSRDLASNLIFEIQPKNDVIEVNNIYSSIFLLTPTVTPTQASTITPTP